MKNFRLPVLFAILVAAPLAWAQTNFNPVPTRIFGQAILQQQGVLTASAPNLVEGREFSGPQGVAVDDSSSPPILYVADTLNNRVLAWKNAGTFTKGDFADKVIGQRDLFSTSAKGPGSDLSTGLNQPIALAVDKSGNLYVVDALNNRVVRYPAPYQQTSALLAIDLILGQTDSNGRLANQGMATPNATTLSFSSGGSGLRSGLAFDKQGNLWVSDSGNNRVLRFPAAALASGAANDPAADLVLGHSDFTTSALPTGAAVTGKDFLAQPSGMAFDPQGRLFVPDDANRVLVFVPPFVSGQLAARILGVVLPTQQMPTPPVISASTLGATTSAGRVPPESVFFVGNNPFVLDTGNNRILKYDPFDQWPAEGTTFSPAAISVVGQPDFLSSRVNRNQPQPSSSSLASPVGSFFFNNELYVADSANNRVLVFPLQGGTFVNATRLLGQVDFQYGASNLIEGREVFFENQFGVAGGSVVIDVKSDPPHMYVADPANNRVLGFRDYRKIMAGVTADLVIGQPDFFTNELNYPKNDPVQVNDQGLSFPQGVAVDSAGNLYVADTGNGRVLRFPKPFDQSNLQLERPNLVLGQSSYFTKVTDASSQTMRAPYGIAFTADGFLVVSDSALNRVLFFRKPLNGDFTFGQTATNVIGQPDFGPPTETVFNGPRQIAVDADDHLYVADTGDNRILIFRNVSTSGNDPSPSFALTTGVGNDGLRSPYGVWVNPTTQEVWVADTGNSRLLRYPRFEQLIASPSANASLVSFTPLAVTLDPFGSPVSAEGGTNRVAFFSPAIDFGPSAGGVASRFSGNAASYLGRFAPGMLASIFSYTNTRFGDQTVSFDSLPNPLPIPTTLGDVQVTVGGIPAPLLYVSPSQINFQVPYATPFGSQPQEIRVIRASTGQILASSLFRFDDSSPGLFTANSTGSGQLAALNQDNTVNNGTHPAKAGTVIQLFGTGAGPISGAPPDGTVATGIIMTDQKPKVFINSGFVPDEDVLFSGLAPGFVGVWQINVRVPKDVPPGDVPVVVFYKGVNSNLDQFGDRRMTTIRTAP